MAPLPLDLLQARTHLRIVNVMLRMQCSSTLIVALLLPSVTIRTGTAILLVYLTIPTCVHPCRGRFAPAGQPKPSFPLSARGAPSRGKTATLPHLLVSQK